MQTQQIVLFVCLGLFMFAVIGGLALLSNYYTLNGIKSWTVGDGQYGTARFATEKEIRETYAHIPYRPDRWRKGEELPTKQELVVGYKKKGGSVTALVDSGDIHCLMIGAAGVGKTANFLYPSIEYACASGMSFLIEEIYEVPETILRTVKYAERSEVEAEILRREDEKGEEGENRFLFETDPKTCGLKHMSVPLKMECKPFRLPLRID